ncbi:HlyD family secretion protein [Pontibacter kalidii]|uniref:HlyD family secretion protein n=1 Tax=Pontibacter kalidii TaxID=2592049 RepID=UPI00225BE4DE|nr:HlyD family secretion protein [Pontibacter kalidii]
MRHRTKKLIYNAVVITLVVGGIVWVSSRFIHLGNVEYTDNAQVKQLIVPVNSRVPGFVKAVYFEEHQPVKKGDTLAIIEDAEFILRLAQAEADYQNALAGKMVVSSSVSTAQNNVSVSDASIAEVKALLDNAEKDYKRYKNLLAQESVTQKEFDEVSTRYKSLKAKYQTLVRQKQTMVSVKNEHNTRLEQNEAVIKLAEAALDLAKLNLSYTVIVAPTDGYTGRKNIQEGQLIQPGQTIVDVVDNNEKWVVANYKETQTHHIREGQSVEIEVDALPGAKLKGVVKSISGATGASFSMIPQDNSAGNFVKVEQRIPVRIEFAKESAELLNRLRAGMNVECLVQY